MSEVLTILDLKARAREGALSAAVHVQVEDCLKKEGSNGKPFFELKLRDAGDNLLLRAWTDTPAYSACEVLDRGMAVEVSGEFSVSPQFGLEGKRWKIRELDREEAETLFNNGAVNPEEVIAEVTAEVTRWADPRLQALGLAFLREFGLRFARASAARANHHARRGGLAEHTLQMLKSAEALTGVYPSLNRDLLLAGVLFHDCGKLWETCPPERGFEIPRELRGEMLGHITIGIEVVNSLWRNLPLDEWKDLQPPSESVRLHLLHLIAAHHGELQYGSPVEPKTPEAFALNAIDNLDAKLEMFHQAIRTNTEVAPGILDRVRPLNVFPVVPLPRFQEP